MKSGLLWRLLITLMVAILGIGYALPSVLDTKTSPLAAVLPADKINLGLDLQGGIHLTLGVEVGKAVQNALSQAGQELRTVAREEGIIILRTEAGDDERLRFVLARMDDRERLAAILARTFDYLVVEKSEMMEGGRVAYTLAPTPEYRTYTADLALEQAVKTIRNRVDEFGVTEPDIRKQQDYRIQIQLPGLSDPRRAIQIIGKTAHLEFKIVNEDADVEKAVKGVLPPGSELRFMVEENPNGSSTQRPMVLYKNALLTGEYITNAKINFDSFNQAYVGLTFNRRGGDLFERLTGEHVKERLAIVLDGKIYSAPVIQERISGGRASISGSFTENEARDLAIVLRAGALPAPVTILEERSVGPSLGQESIDNGIQAALLGGALVLIFIVLYYGMAGLFADFALVFNIILIMGCLAAFGATLTLPGIAGIILTIGMAVDANVLIFERIREELRNGLTVRAAVAEGFDKARLTILDANVTTFLAAIILYQFGTGPIRGFAVTLGIGIVASFFTALFVSRILFDLWLSRKARASLSI